MQRPRFSNPRLPQLQQPPRNPAPTPRYPQNPRVTTLVSNNTPSASSFDSGRGTYSTGGNSFQSGNGNRPPVATIQNDDDWDDWGDEDDDMDLVAASQAVETAAAGTSSGGGGRYGGSPHRQEMGLVNLRMELAYKESNGEEVRQEDFMQDGVLGGDISSRQGPQDKDRIQELERLNVELKNENYSCKGEVTNLRKLLQKQTQERQKELINRQAREEENRKKEAETREKDAREFEKTKTDLKYASNQLRSSNERCEAFKKQLQRLQAQVQSQQSGSPAATNNNSYTNAQSTFNQTLNLNSSRIIPPSVSLSSMGFNSRASFSAREVQTPSTPKKQQETELPQTINITSSPKKETRDRGIQTLQTEIETLEKKWKEELELQKRLTTCIVEQVSVASLKDLKRLLPRVKKLSSAAEDKLIKGLDLQGYRYEMFFPDNLKVAEFILDIEAKKQVGKLPPELRLPKFPSECEDWNGTVGFEEGLQALLFGKSSNIWGALCFVFNDLHQRIEFMRMGGNRNSLYRSNNCGHFFKLLIWGVSLLTHSCYNVWQGWGDKLDSRKEKDNFEQIRQWSACVLWIGNRNFEVENIQVELRKLVLRALTQIASEKMFHYTPSNYLRLYNVIFNTLTTDIHVTLENLIECLKAVRVLDRKKFCLTYVCRKQNDGSCLANLFATNSLEFFEKEKSVEKRFELYNSYVKFLISIREWCTVHSNGECNTMGLEAEPVQEDDPDDFITRPVFNPPNNGSQAETESGRSNASSASASINPADPATAARSSKPSANFDNTIHSMYGSEDASYSTPEYEDEDMSSSSLSGRSEPAPKKQKLGLGDQSSIMFNETIQEEGEGSESAMDVEEEEEESKDEWDQTQFLVLEMNANASQAPPSPDRGDLPCRKFLDCSLWEDDQRGPKASHCQCRFYLLETFMKMTEKMIPVWRHVKISYEYNRKSSEAAKSSAEKREEELEQLIKSMDAEKSRQLAARGESKTKQDLEDDYSVNLETGFWSRLVTDNQVEDKQLSPKAIADTMTYAVEIMFDAFITTQMNTRFAFGKDGTNAFHAAGAFLFRYSNDLNFPAYIKKMVRRISVDLKSADSEDFASRVCTQSQSEDMDASASTVTSTGMSSFDREFTVKEIPKFDPNNPEIVQKLPASLVKSIVEFNERKAQAKRLYNSTAAQDSDEDEETDFEDEEAAGTSAEAVAGPSTRKPSKKKGTAPELTDEGESESAAANDSEDDYVSTDESHDEVDEPSDDGDSSENDDEEDQPWPKLSKKYRKVHDYDQFCGPSMDEGYPPGSDEEPDEDSLKVSWDEVKAEFAKDNSQLQMDKGLYVGYKTVKQVCDELEASERAGRSDSDPLFNGPVPGETETRHLNVESKEEEEQLMESLMSSLSVEGYYSDKAKIWDDYNRKSLPVKI